MSAQNEIEELRNKKTGLQEESHSLNEKQTNLDERVKILEEKIAIEELKNGNKATRDTISQLESKIDALEQKLREVSQGTDVHEPENFSTPATETFGQNEQTTPPPSESALEGSEDEGITVERPVQPAVVAEAAFDESQKAHEKKKRKLF